MTAKQATLTLPDGKVLEFYFPATFTNQSIVDGIKAIRLGSPRNWRREFTELIADIKEVPEVKLDTEFKYIVLHDDRDEKHRTYMVVFPKSINHDYMHEAAQHIAFDQDFTDHTPVMARSAGFVTTKCHGVSETLGVKSNEEDSLKMLN